MKGKFQSLFSDTRQLTRIVILAGILLVLVIVIFGGIYAKDRNFFGLIKSKPEQVEVNLAEAEQAVRDNPQNTEMRMALAEVYMYNNRYADALVQANQVMMKQPDNQRAWLVIGIANANLGKPADAIEPLTKFVDARKDQEMPGLDRSLQAAAYYLGDSYLQLGKPQEAIEPLKQAVEWSKTDADAMYKLGMAYSGVQDYASALNMFHYATTFVPDFQEAYDAMAAAYDAGGLPDYGDYARGMSAYARKDYSEAIDLLLKSAQALPNFAPTFAGLGLAYEAQSKLEDAKSAYEAALKLEPENFTASNGLQRVDILINKTTN
jgi:tetratricopeptide (TPR) repeat protein